MKEKKISDVLKESLKVLFLKPYLFLIGAVLFFGIWIFSRTGGKLAYNLQTTPANVIWVIFSMITFFAFLSLFSVFMIKISKNVLEKKKWNFEIGKKFFSNWISIFFVLWIFLIFFNLINLTLYAFTRIMIGLSGSFTVSPGVFKLISTLIAFAWIAGVIIFFAFSNFVIVVKEKKTISGMKGSMKIVKKKYVETLLLSISFFVLISLVRMLPEIAVDFVNYILVIPFLFVLMTKFVLEFWPVEK